MWLPVAMQSVGRAGWRALVLGLLGALLAQMDVLPLPSSLDVLLFPVFALLGAVVLVALVRVLAAHRPDPLPPLPVVDDSGRRVARSWPVPALSPADASPRVALRRAAGLARWALLAYIGLELLLLAIAVLFVLPFAADSFDLGGNETLGDREALAVLVPAQLVATLLTTFVALVPQRLGLEGDPRVLVAAAHSVRVARTAFGPMFLLSLLRSAPGLGAAALVAYDRPIAARLALALVAIPVELFVVASFNEIYARGPRLDVPVELTTPRAPR